MEENYLPCKFKSVIATACAKAIAVAQGGFAWRGNPLVPTIVRSPHLKRLAMTDQYESAALKKLFLLKIQPLQRSAIKQKIFHRILIRHFANEFAGF